MKRTRQFPAAYDVGTDSGVKELFDNGFCGIGLHGKENTVLRAADGIDPSFGARFEFGA